MWIGVSYINQDHPIVEAENIFDANQVIDIGKIMTNRGDVHGEFIE